MPVTRAAAGAKASNATRGRSDRSRIGRSMRWYDAMATTNVSPSRSKFSVLSPSATRDGTSQTSIGQCQR